MSKPYLAGGAYRLVVLVGFIAVLALNLPGHLTYDSVAQLHEGRVGVRETWGPAFYSLLLAFCDRFVGGTALYVGFSTLVLFASLASLPAMRPRVSWWAPLAALLVIATPHVLIGQGIVWKDVAFGNAAVASLIWLAHADRCWDDRPRRWLYLALSLALMIVAAQMRQNGAIVGLLAAIATGWVASRGRWRRGMAWTAGAMVAFVLVNQIVGAFSLAALKPNPVVPTGSGVGYGFRLIQGYDLAGAVTRDPSYRLAIIARTQPRAARIIETHAPSVYSTQRVDFLKNDPILSDTIRNLPDDTITDQWLDLVGTRPLLYGLVRAGDLRWLVAPPILDRCLPIAVGVDPNPVLAKVGISPRKTPTDVRLYNYATWFFDTPVYSHLTYAFLSLVIAMLLLWRRRVGDIPMAFLQLGGLAFTACFFVISIACDWRYLYFLDLAAMVGVIYFAIDPSVPWRRRSRTIDPA